MFRANIAAVTCCLLLTQPVFSGELQGIVYDLEKTDPVTKEFVDITVFDVVRDADGVAVRDPNTTRLVKGGPLFSTTASRLDGSYKVTPPAIPGADRRLVIIEFNRRGFAVTQLLDGVVLDEKRPALLDIAVPEPLQTPQCVHQVHYHAHHKQLFGKFWHH